jgi:hypothetical protein
MPGTPDPDPAGSALPATADNPSPGNEVMTLLDGAVQLAGTDIEPIEPARPSVTVTSARLAPLPAPDVNPANSGSSASAPPKPGAARLVKPPSHLLAPIAWGPNKLIPEVPPIASR